MVFVNLEGIDELGLSQILSEDRLLLSCFETIVVNKDGSGSLKKSPSVILITLVGMFACWDGSCETSLAPAIDSPVWV